MAVEVNNQSEKSEGQKTTGSTHLTRLEVEQACARALKPRPNFELVLST